MYWLIYKRTDKFIGYTATAFEEYEELEQFISAIKNIEIVDIAESIDDEE